jgi:hypothetical protein
MKRREEESGRTSELLAEFEVEKKEREGKMGGEKVREVMGEEKR